MADGLEERNHLLSPLLQEPRPSESSTSLNPPHPNIYQNIKSKNLFWIGQGVFFLTSITLLALSYKTTINHCNKKLSIFSPALEAINDEYQIKRFDGSFFADSPYKGPPSEALDGRWYDLFNKGAFSISHETLIEIGGFENSVKLPPESGGGYMAQLEVYHQLHCLHFLWQNTHPLYYNISEGAKNQSSTYRKHVDHCADILRQKLMCNADIGVITYNWIKHISHPVPNFSTLHKCINFEDISEWQAANQAPAPYGGKVTRPLDAMDLEKIP